MNWKPKLNGKVYCALACGDGCTKAAYDKAVKDADALVARLKGSGWRPVVFENTGWHHRAISGPVQVYPSGDGRFWAMIGSRPKGNAGGLAMWTPERNPHFKDPNRAVRNALGYVEDRMAELNKTLAAARKAAGVNPTTRLGVKK
jgi:hypothetical protein